MDPGKLQSILNWPLPTGLKAIQRFIGFSNCYRRFVNGFSSIIAPITNMTKKGANTKIWSMEALAAFETLKETFASAPILVHPDTSLPFLLEVDASETALRQGCTVAKTRVG
ncbi:uncharacterized protein LOC134585597 [Pelobates fuscus]|uniref:uncharacterized protein LOC134585597 n=1 Tax=Pelobates fuscus TaxID=191477 RepID=UPI002FE43039